MSHPSDISVVIPTLNRRELLARALESVQAQTLTPIEIWVVDDASTDGTLDMLRSRFPEVHPLVQPQTRGVSAARNRGIENARGNWIAFLDSDDEWRPDKLSKQLEALNESPHRICHTNEVWIRHGRRVNPMAKHEKRGGRIYQHCLPLCAISPSSVLLERSLLNEVGGFDETLPACEDYDLWLRVTCQYPVLYLEEPLVVKYGGHGDQLSTQFWGMDRFRVRALEKVLAENRLSPEDRHKTLETLINKCEILMRGARKRGRLERAAEYALKLEHFRAASEAGTTSRISPLYTGS